MAWKCFCSINSSKHAQKHMSTKEYFTTSRRQCKTFSGKKVYDEKKKLKISVTMCKTLKRLFQLSYASFPSNSIQRILKAPGLDG